MNAFEQIRSVITEEALLSDQLRIIAGERNGLRAEDRETLRTSAVLIEDMLARYQSMWDEIIKGQAQLAAVSERLHETDTRLRKMETQVPQARMMFPTISAQICGTSYK